jgi:hypothetical protein
VGRDALRLPRSIRLELDGVRGSGRSPVRATSASGASGVGRRATSEQVREALRARGGPSVGLNGSEGQRKRSEGRKVLPAGAG